MMTKENSQTKNLLILAFGAFCISFAPIFVKMIDPASLGPTAIGFWRTLFGAAILFVWSILKGDELKVSKRTFLFSILAGFVFFLDLFVWHKSVVFIGAGIATILGNTQVFWMALIGVVLFAEILKPQYLIAVFAAFIGVILLVGVGSIEDFSTIYIKGIVFGLMTGIFYASYITVIKKSADKNNKVSIITLMAYVSFFSAFFLGIAMLFESDPIIPPDNYSWFTLLGLALVAQSIGWWVIATTIQKLRASQSGMVLLLQPTLATVWGALFFAESMHILQILGAAITIVAIYFGSVRIEKIKKAKL